MVEVLEMSSDPICNICNQAILEDDDYLILDTFKLGLFESRAHYHEECFRDKMKLNKQLHGKAKALMDKTEALMAGLQDG